MATSILDIIEQSYSPNIHILSENNKTYLEESDVSTKLWKKTIPATIWNDLNSWGKEHQSLKAYRNGYQIMVCRGTLNWAVSLLQKLNHFFDEGYLNIETTHWIFVLSYNEDVSGYRNGNLQSFKLEVMQQEEIWEKMNVYIREDMNIAVLLANVTTNQINVACMTDNHDRRNLGFCGYWRPKGKKFISPMWPESLRTYNGRTVRATVVQKPSVLTFKSVEDGLLNANGWTAELARIVQKKLNFTTILVPTNTFGSQKKDKSWSGMMGVLYEDKADVAILDFSPLHQRLDYIEFSTFMSTDYEIILSQSPQIFIDPFLLLKIFSPIMWILLTVTTILAGIVTGLIVAIEDANYETQNAKLTYHIYHCTGMILKKFVYQSSTYCPNGNGGRLLSGNMFLIAFIVYSIYDGSIISFLAIPHRTKPIDTLTDLLESHSIPAVRKDTTSAIYILQRTTDITVELSKKIVPIPGKQLSTWSFFSQLADGHYAFVDTLTSAIGRANRFEKKGESCMFYVSKAPVKVDHDNFAYRRNFPLKRSFNKIIKQMRSFGIIEELKKKHYALPCQPLVHENEISPFKLIQLQSAFFLLLIGCSASLMMFILEFVIKLHF